MQTNFTTEALTDPQMDASEKIVRSCVHCGFCTATCPTYLLAGDELDSPRGRIYLIKEMLEAGTPASANVVKHVDRCLSCLSCMSTCPSGVNYMHLVDHARAYIEETYTRPPVERLLRRLLGTVLPNPRLFRLALGLGRLARPMQPILARLPHGDRISAMLELVPREPQERQPFGKPATTVGKRVVILEGCAQPVLRPSINAATRRLLDRLGVVVVAKPAPEGCCGAIVHHLGQAEASLEYARKNIDAWMHEFETSGLDAIIITASGCGTTVKDYGFMLREDVLYARKAAFIASLAKDITEYLANFEMKPAITTGQVVAYHSACSMQHGQQIKNQPKALLKAAGFVVRDVPEAHICCGSAGTYNILQPEIAGKLKARKIANIERVGPQIIAAGNIGCMAHLAASTGIPLVHTVELLDWATGGPQPSELKNLHQEIPHAGLRAR